MMMIMMMMLMTMKVMTMMMPSFGGKNTDETNTRPTTGGDDVDAESLDVWCTSSEFLDIMAGDWEEHATLLCNFFLHLKQEAYIVFGRGIPEGDTVYVMTRERGPDRDEIFFWNASKGKRYNAKDIHCTLKEVYTIVDQHNIWANTQSTKSIPNTKFDLNDAKVG